MQICFFGITLYENSRYVELMGCAVVPDILRPTEKLLTKISCAAYGSLLVVQQSDPEAFARAEENL